MTRREVIQQRIKALEKEYQGVKATNDYALEAYGSELAVGGLAKRETDVLDKIQHFIELSNMPEVDKNMETLDGLLDHIGREIVTIEIQEIALAAKKKELQDRRSCLEELMQIPLSVVE